MCNHEHNIVCTHTCIHLKEPNPLCESVTLAVTNTKGLFVWEKTACVCAMLRERQTVDVRLWGVFYVCVCERSRSVGIFRQYACLLSEAICFPFFCKVCVCVCVCASARVLGRRWLVAVRGSHKDDVMMEINAIHHKHALTHAHIHILTVKHTFSFPPRATPVNNTENRRGEQGDKGEEGWGNRGYISWNTAHDSLKENYGDTVAPLYRIREGSM